MELHTITTHNRTLCESIEKRDIQAQELATTIHTKDESLDNNDYNDLTLFKSLAPGLELCKHIEKASDFLDFLTKSRMDTRETICSPI